MFFKFDEDEEDSDDDLYHGVLPDTDLFHETQCTLCEENEESWGRIQTDLYTRKQFKAELKKFYDRLVRSGTISMFVDLLSNIYPKQLNNYIMLDHLLDSSNTKQELIKNKIEKLFELDEQITTERGKLAMTVNKKHYTRDLIDSITERKRMAKFEVEHDGLTESTIQFRKHLCDPKCVWCRKHCFGEEEHTTKGKLCDCKCTIFPNNIC